MKKRITVLDVAKRVGVSHTAVSKALRGSSEISAELTAQIRKVAAEMRYKPRAAAQLLRANQMRQLGFIVAATDTATAFSQGFTGPIIGALIEGCTSADYRYMIELFHHSKEFVEPHIVRSGLVDGCIVIGDAGDVMRTWLDQNAGIPVVTIGEPSRYCLLVDGAQAVTSCMEYLKALGHSRVAFSGAPVRYAAHHAAFEAFQAGLIQYQMTLAKGDAGVYIASGGDARLSAKADVEWARQVLVGADRPTAVLCHGDSASRAVIQAAAECRLRIPQDLSVLSWGFEPAFPFYPVPTCFAAYPTAIANAALAKVLKLIEEEPVEKPQDWISHRVVAADTTGSAPKEIRPGLAFEL